MEKFACRKWRFWLLLTALLFCLNGCSGGSPWNHEVERRNSKTEDGSGEAAFHPEQLPAYDGKPFVTVNDNQPYFSDSERTKEAFEQYSELDELGRCGVAFANICEEIMPTEERGAIGQVKPSGWHTVKYNDLIDGNYLYNRCHLIGYQLAGENANEKNLITGTRALNTEGMLPYENQVAEYVKETRNHVLYRVTPIFEGDNLVASGVLMEAESVEDAGSGICFCVYVYNCQPGIVIDYGTGESWRKTEGGTAEATQKDNAETENTYILNTNTHKFHKADCAAAKKIGADNKQTVTKSREAVISEGYEPCKQCNP